jgi:hypothetical protein
LFRFFMKKGREEHVVKLSDYARSKNMTRQMCSSCRKKTNRLSFYADENGGVIGLCKDCKKKADQRGLIPL